MKLPVIEGEGGGEMEESAAPDPQEMLMHGKELCRIGEAICVAAQAMGAEDVGEEPYSEEAPMEEAEEAAPASDPLAAKKNAIIIAIKKKQNGKKY